jgi:hypothetical protein
MDFGRNELSQLALYYEQNEYILCALMNVWVILDF